MALVPAQPRDTAEGDPIAIVPISKNCKLCTHAYHREIDNLLLHGLTPYEVSEFANRNWKLIIGPRALEAHLTHLKPAVSALISMKWNLLESHNLAEPLPVQIVYPAQNLALEFAGMDEREIGFARDIMENMRSKEGVKEVLSYVAAIGAAKHLVQAENPAQYQRVATTILKAIETMSKICKWEESAPVVQITQQILQSNDFPLQSYEKAKNTLAKTIEQLEG